MNWTMVIAVFFGVWETSYFGWNWYPASDAELISDGITCLLFSLAFIAGRQAP